VNPYESPLGLDEPPSFSWMAREVWACVLVTLFTIVLSVIALLTWPLFSATLFYMAAVDAGISKKWTDWILTAVFGLICFMGSACWSYLLLDLFS
jgi:hypothetical protein